MYYFGIDQKDWVQIEQCSVASIMGAQIFFDQYGNFSWHLNGLRFRNLILHLKGHSLRTFVPKQDLDFITESLKPRFLSLDKELLAGIKQITSTSYKKLGALSKYVRLSKLSSLTDDQLATLFLDYFQIISNDIFLVNFKPLELSAISALRELVFDANEDPAVAIDGLSALSAMEKPSVSTREEIDLCQIAMMTLEPAKIRRSLTRTRNRQRLVSRNYPDLFELFEKHYKKYRFMIGGYSEMGWEMDDFLRRYMNILELGPEWATERIEHLSAHTRNVGLKKRRTLSKLKDNGTISKISKVVNDLALLDESNRAAFAQSLEIREILNTELFERIKMEPLDLRYYTITELLNLIRNRVKIDQKEITRRSRGLIFNSGISMYSGSDATRFLDKHIPVNPRKTILNGTCIFPGIFEGEVKLVRSLDESQNTLPGAVVVTNSTGSEFAEAIRKAGAVIVESDGMLTPVAQMCRETQTPCLINVAGALDSFQNGDQVIIDAQGQNVCFTATADQRQMPIDLCAIKVFDFDSDEPSVSRLEEIQPENVHIFGSIATTLAMLLRDGFQVPNGFVLGRSTMYQFLADNGCEIVDGTYTAQTVERARKILTEGTSTDFLRNLPLDATVIFDEDGCVVRPSWLPGDIAAAAALRPSLTTLAIRTLEGLWKAIRRCWLGFLEQPLVLEKAGAGSSSVGGGVIIQQYKPGDRSGVIKSMDLEHPGSNVMTLKTCLGVVNSLFTGKSRPDRYRISRKTERIINRVIPLKTRFEMVQPKTGKLILIPVPEDIVESEVLSRQQIKMLVSSALRIEKMIENPVELIWTIKGGETFFLNAERLKKD